MGSSGIRDRDRGAAGQQCETTDGGSMEGRVGSAQYKPRLDRNCQQLLSLLAKSSVNSWSTKTATCSTAAHPPANKATAAHSSSSPLHLGSFTAIEIVNWSCEGFCFSLLKYRSATLQAAAAHTPRGSLAQRAPVLFQIMLDYVMLYLSDDERRAGMH